MHLTTSRVGALAFLFSTLATLAACSGGAGKSASGSTSPTEGTADDSAPTVVGVYTAQSKGPINEIALESNSAYILSSNDCGTETAPCTSVGTFAFGDGGTTLSLTDGTTGKTQTLPFSVLSTANLGEAAQSEELTQIDDLLVTGTGSPLVNLDAGGLVNADAGAPIVSSNGGLVSSAQNGNPVVAADGGSLVTAATSAGLTSCTGTCALTVQVNGQTLVSAAM